MWVSQRSQTRCTASPSRRDSTSRSWLQVHARLLIECDSFPAFSHICPFWWGFFEGESGLGKSTLVNSLFLTDLYKDRKLLNAEGKAASRPPNGFTVV